MADLTIEWDLKSGSKYIAGCAGVLGFITLLLGICGCCAYKNATKCRVYTFGCLSLFVGIFLIILGSVLVSFYVITPAQIDTFCDMAYMEPTQFNKGMSRKQFRSIDWK